MPQKTTELRSSGAYLRAAGVIFQRPVLNGEAPNILVNEALLLQVCQ
ncbi:hypothetical protein [Paenibacillus sp. LPE1-1-1.1]